MVSGVLGAGPKTAATAGPPARPLAACRHRRRCWCHRLLLCLSDRRSLFSRSNRGIPAPHAGGEPGLFPDTDHAFRPWLFLVVPAIGGILSGLLVYTVA